MAGRANVVTNDSKGVVWCCPVDRSCGPVRQSNHSSNDGAKIVCSIRRFSVSGIPKKNISSRPQIGPNLLCFHRSGGSTSSSTSIVQLHGRVPGSRSRTSTMVVQLIEVHFGCLSIDHVELLIRSHHTDRNALRGQLLVLLNRLDQRAKTVHNQVIQRGFPSLSSSSSLLSSSLSQSPP